MGKSNSANTIPPFVQDANTGAPADKMAAVNEELEGVVESSDGLSEEVTASAPAEAETAIYEATAPEPVHESVTAGTSTAALSTIEADEAATSAVTNPGNSEASAEMAEAVAVADDDSAGGVSEVAAVAENATEVRADSTFLSGINIAT